MICKYCGENMSGDGYTKVWHCPNGPSLLVDQAEPDSGPIDCGPNYRYYTDEHGKQVRAKYNNETGRWTVVVEGSVRGTHANPDETVPRIYKVKWVPYLSLSGSRGEALRDNAKLYKEMYEGRPTWPV